MTIEEQPRRRPGTFSALAAAAAVGAVAVLIPVAVSRLGSSHPRAQVVPPVASSSSRTGPSPSLVKPSLRPLAANGPLEQFSPYSVSFPDPSHGWSFGNRCNSAGSCIPALKHTVDGGRTWRDSPAPHLHYRVEGDRALRDGAIGHVLFTDPQHGYLFDPALYVTTDGGRTWQRVHEPNGIRELQYDGRRVWGLPVCSGQCPDNNTVLVGVPGQPFTAMHPPMPQPYVRGLSARAGVALLTLGTALGGNGARPPNGTLLRTTDGGGTWRKASLPCPNTGEGYDARSTPATADAVWLLCAVGGGGPPPDYTLYRSTDGGRRWHTTSPTQLTTGSVNGKSSLPPVVLGRDALLIGTQVTRDAGRSWTSVPTLSDVSDQFSSSTPDADTVWLTTSGRDEPAPAPVVYGPVDLLVSHDNGRTFTRQHLH